MTKTERFNLRVTPEFKKRIQALSKKIGSDSDAETVREAITLYEMYVRAIDSGSALALLSPDGSTSRIVII